MVVGEILCEPMEEGERHFSPRYIARTQLNMLEEKGYVLQSSFSLDQYLMNSHTLMPINNGGFCSPRGWEMHNGLLFDLHQSMMQGGIPLDPLDALSSGGHYRVRSKPTLGIESMDNCFRFKEAIKEMTTPRGILTTHMTKPFPLWCPSSFVFSHSLLKKDSSTCAFYDPKDFNRMSPLAKNWIGGIQKHAFALAALCSPTVNCYRRLNSLGFPSLDGLGRDEPAANAFVRRHLGDSMIWLENRLPSSACNPYLVMAATIAAGIDGIEQPLKPQPPADSRSLPLGLSDALRHLEQDNVLKHALGEDFVHQYCAHKRRNETEKLAHSSVTEERENDYILERMIYFEEEPLDRSHQRHRNRNPRSRHSNLSQSYNEGSDIPPVPEMPEDQAYNNLFQ